MTKYRTTSLIVLAILNLIVIGVMQSFNSSLQPFSIIGFEFAWTPEQAHLMVNAWKENDVLDVVNFVIGFDYLFMLTYSSFLWLACLSTAEGLLGKISKALTVLAWMQPLASLLDAVENFALFQILSGSWKPMWPILAAVCATPKFAIVVTAILACLTGGIYKVMRKK